ncbi:hypothetical protein ILYODFUR_024979 [Ilyodon furcidens]|uniref:Uncharacterized protein n=1 Tax=Ilyodon furcidens TaxID=33524 RepID=A0ABV0TC13_9TELE
MGPRDFFVGPEKLHLCTKFHIPQSKHGSGLVVLVLLGGAEEKLGHTHQLLPWIPLGDWTNISHIEFGGDQMKNVNIRGKRKAMALRRTSPRRHSVHYAGQNVACRTSMIVFRHFQFCALSHPSQYCSMGAVIVTYVALHCSNK